MTTEQLEQLMQAHKCGFCVFTCEEGYYCELSNASQYDGDIIGYGTGPSIVEAVYEALKSKMGADAREMMDARIKAINDH